MATTKRILTSLHGKKVGLNNKGDLVVGGRRVVTEDDAGVQKLTMGAPVAVDATATLTIADLLAGTITSAAAAVTATLPTGTLTDAGVDFEVGDAFEWTVIKVGANSFTVQAGDDHTLVGSGVVATATSAQFRTRKTAANTYVTYRIN